MDIYFCSSRTLASNIGLENLNVFAAACLYVKPTQGSNKCLWKTFNSDAVSNIYYLLFSKIFYILFALKITSAALDLLQLCAVLQIIPQQQRQ